MERRATGCGSARTVANATLGMHKIRFAAAVLYRRQPVSARFQSVSLMISGFFVQRDSSICISGVLQAGRNLGTSIACDCPRTAIARILLVSLFRMNYNTLDPVYEFERAVTAVLQRLCGLAPAAVENGIGGRDASGGSGILASHDADENADRGSGVAPCQRTNFNKSLCFAHLGFSAVRSAMLA
ncbi:hypothetical protein CQ13_26905 [Bradyrhizobium retamae]|uniref:Uncharacterized protein n=1 Tax=Bradyrhizobium retamae TaxID=1300035 RepID=A0A0R3MVW8_9BRAD|nr:hypothetical protein CQ13_26905 [Bradyrhizobium retamae]